MRNHLFQHRRVARQYNSPARVGSCSLPTRALGAERSRDETVGPEGQTRGAPGLSAQLPAPVLSSRHPSSPGTATQLPGRDAMPRDAPLPSPCLCPYLSTAPCSSNYCRAPQRPPPL